VKSLRWTPISRKGYWWRVELACVMDAQTKRISRAISNNRPLWRV